MLPAYILSVREGLEAALIIGIVLGALQKLRHAELKPVVWAGALSAASISVLLALFFHRLGVSLEGMGEQIFEGVTMLLAAGVLTWMIFWMQRQARSLQSNLETDVRRASLQSNRSGLFSLAFLAVGREGLELALFLTATALASETRQTLIGALLGLATAGLIGWALYTSTLQLNLRRFFQATGFLLLLFAAGLVAHGVHEFNEVGWIPTLIDPVWDINHVLDEQSFAGQILKSLFGYNGNPSLSEVGAYLGYFALVSLALWRGGRPVTAYQEA